MTRSTVNWTLAAAAAALLALPAPSVAQTPPTSQPPATQPSASSAGTQDVPAAAQEHLRQARSALNDIKTTDLDSRGRTQLTELKKRLSNLERAAGINDNASATGQANRNPEATANRGKVNWGTEVAAIDKALTTLLGPASTTGAATTPDPAATGTSGTTGQQRDRSNVTLDATTRTKLEEVRTHITAFATAMAGGQSPSPSAEPSPAPTATSDPAASSTPTSSAAATGTPAATSSSAPTATSATQPPAEPQTGTPAQTEAVNEDAARRHLTEARNTLSALTQLPAAAQLTGEARTHVSQLITNFNELITTQSEWRAAYAKVSANLTALIGAETETAAADTTGTTGTGTAGTVGTSGSGTELDPALREKLVELRRNLSDFERAAGGNAAAPSADSAGMTAATSTPSTSAANPAASSSTTSSSGTSASAASGTTGTPGTSTSPTTATSSDPQAAGAQTAQGGNAEIMRHVAAIDTLLKMQDDSGGLTLTKAQVEQLRTHWTALRQILERR